MAKRTGAPTPRTAGSTPPRPAAPPARPATDACPHVVIEDVRPSLDGGRYPVKRVAGVPCVVQATIFRDGHAAVQAVLKWRARGGEAPAELPMRLENPGLDLWTAEFPLESPGRYFFSVEAWTDAYASWLADFRKRVDAGQPARSEAEEGAALVEGAATFASGAERTALEAAAAGLRERAADGPAALKAASDPGVTALMARHQPRPDAVRHPELGVIADRPRAVFGAWYEMFPRSQGTTPGRASTLREAERRLQDIRNMGFDVLYLPPVHPIGRTHRKGPNNALAAGTDDPGSPWAVGSESGGHDAIEPALGTFDDFDHFVEAARAHSLEIALDFAIQCSPDHPWVREHPEWFYQRPDGTIKYAENPPKKYEDIYPLNFDTRDRQGLWREMRRVLEVWIGHGVRIFRVDNPHTKPTAFWEWLIADVTASHPDVLFLAEAFTRPAMMRTLAKLGFTQSYTYFTWRHTKEELTEYLTELTRPGMLDFFRPNFFVNTPDILPPILVSGGRPAFKQRLVLAATLSPSYGVYSGYELCESASIPHHAIPGDVEYADSEKYEIRVRDWDAPGHIKDFIARVNAVRRDNPALQQLGDLRFLKTDNENILFYARRRGDNVILTAVNLDPHQAHHATAWVPPDVSGVAPDGRYHVRDLLTDATYVWGVQNYVRLDPQVEPAHVLRVEKIPG